MLRHLPMTEPKPNGREFIAILMGCIKSARVPLVEYLVDEVVMRPIVTGLLGREWVPWSAEREAQQRWLDSFIQFWYRLGYDFVRFERSLDFRKNSLVIADTAPGSTKMRGWADEHQGTIMSWADFERYPWPTVEGMDFFPFEYIATHLPEGMGLLTSHAGGMFEQLSQIMSLEGLSLALYDQPDLVKAISDRLGELMLGFYRHLLDLPNLLAIFPGDDMGFRTATLIAPSALRQYTLPWHKRFAKMTHARGLPYFLHSCGNLETIIEDLISNVRIDGKHSYEDAILPVEEFQARYGERIAVLGGVDVNVLTVGSPEDVRRRVRQLIEVCGARGRYVVGSGNSIPSYIPVENYLAMVDEALEQTNRVTK
jgi:uroporphyrinogen decarboxylase